MAQYDDLNARQIWTVGIVSAALTAVTILAVQVLYYALLDRHNQVKLGGSEYTISNQYLDDQAAEIDRYGRDPETGALRIPIDRAMKLVVERQAGRASEDRTGEARGAAGNSSSEANAEPTTTESAPTEPRATEPTATEPTATEPAPTEPTAGDDEA